MQPLWGNAILQLGYQAEMDLPTDRPLFKDGHVILIAKFERSRMKILDQEGGGGIERKFLEF